jgi:hypothetical protein
MLSSLELDSQAPNQSDWNSRCVTSDPPGSAALKSTGFFKKRTLYMRRSILPIRLMLQNAGLNGSKV